jgi:hypothetical protein
MIVASEFNEAAHAARRALLKLLKGRQVRIVSDFYDQPYGASRRNLKGELRVIEDVCVNLETDWPIILLEGHRCYMGLNEVELT